MKAETKNALEFERTARKEIRAKLKAWAGRCRGGTGTYRIDMDECTAVALCLAWSGRFSTDEAVRLAVNGGDIGTGTPLESDLSARKLGYRPVKPQNAIPYAEHYSLAQCDRVVEPPIRDQALSSNSRLAKLVPESSPLFGNAWTWLDAKVRGATHPEAGAACGKTGSARAREGYSNRMEARLQALAVKLGFSADYDTGAGRRAAVIIRNTPHRD